MKKLLLTTAIAAVTAFPALAADANSMFRTEAGPQEIHASEFIGMRVYRAEAADAEEYEGVQDGWDDIGEINDIVLSQDGTVEAVLVDIGGFLGMGENQVAVDMNSIRFVADSATQEDVSDFFLVLNAPREVLEEAPAYEMSGAHEQAGAAAEAEANVETAAEETGDAVAEETSEMASEAEAAAEEAGDTVAETAETAEAETTAAMQPRAPIERDGYVTAEETELTAEKLTGAAAYDANDEWIGEVSELLLTDDGKVKAAVIDVGGFLGLGEKPVELELSKIDILRADDGSDLRVYVSMTEEELKAMPDYEG
ncbi:PRC-barrel domain-containing protein [Leisingera daeponensis]|uniref:PRC-barrel domain-containing protein n=1 Tax=Leisingera daeponensis TaxID=405746 RepID=UPI001C96B531|nr:PRC-barrel domain-containing protein [Leisingera daeponensis]MBY6056862.1 PRC-barrel domain-containing protein [Leisingera daeponensis]